MAKEMKVCLERNLLKRQKSNLLDYPTTAATMQRQSLQLETLHARTNPRGRSCTHIPCLHDLAARIVALTMVVDSSHNIVNVKWKEAPRIQNCADHLCN